MVHQKLSKKKKKEVIKLRKFTKKHIHVWLYPHAGFSPSVQVPAAIDTFWSRSCIKCFIFSVDSLIVYETTIAHDLKVQNKDGIAFQNMKDNGSKKKFAEPKSLDTLPSIFSMNWCVSRCR